MHLVFSRFFIKWPAFELLQRAVLQTRLWPLLPEERIGSAEATVAGGHDAEPSEATGEQATGSTRLPSPARRSFLGIMTRSSVSRRPLETRRPLDIEIVRTSSSSINNSCRSPVSTHI